MRYAVKGKPDFHNVNDERLKSFMDLTQQLIFAYNQIDKEKVSVLKEIWKDLSNENTDRVVTSATKAIEKEPEETEVPKLLKKVPKLRKSPANRKI